MFPPFFPIDEQFSDWCTQMFGKNIDRDRALPVMISLKGYPD